MELKKWPHHQYYALRYVTHVSLELEHCANQSSGCNHAMTSHFEHSSSNWKAGIMSLLLIPPLRFKPGSGLGGGKESDQVKYLAPTKYKSQDG